MKINDMLIGALLVSIFLIGMMTFAVNIGSLNNQSATQMTTTDINISGFQQKVSDTNINATSWKSSFWTSIPFIGVGIVIIQTLWNIGKLVSDSIMGIFNLFFTMITNVLGIPPIVTGVLTTIAVVSLIIAIRNFYTSRD